MGANPKRHHFLPEFYLNGFMRDGFVWLYDRKKKEYRRQQPRNTAVIGHFYTVLNKDGEKDYGIEELLSQVEGRAKPVIDKLEAGDVITPEERLDLSLFVASLISRTPKFEREIEQIADAAHKIIAKQMIPTVDAAAELLRKAGNNNKDITPESMFKFIHEEEFQIKGNRNIAVQTMLDQTQKFAKDLWFMNWMVVHAPEKSAFITSDNPLGFMIPDESRRSAEPILGLASEKVTKLIPLTQRIALFMGNYGAGFGHCSFNRQGVRDTNIAVAKECENFVIGHDEALVRNIVCKTKVDVQNTGTRMKIEDVAHPTDPNRSFIVARRVAADATDTL